MDTVQTAKLRKAPPGGSGVSCPLAAPLRLWVVAGMSRTRRVWEFREVKARPGAQGHKVTRGDLKHRLRSV